MKKFGACVQACIYIKKEASHKSELISQLIFGELYEIIEENKNWTLIRTDFDNYMGWIDNQQVFEICSKEFENLKNQKLFYTTTAISEIEVIEKSEKINLTLGSVLYSNETFKIGGLSFRVCDKNSLQTLINDQTELVKIAYKCLNSPYLWGGRNIMGFDCSGFVQIIYRISNIKLERDSSKQVFQGKEIKELSDTQVLDLAFFGEGEKIDHVGIILENNEIIHCSGKVKIDTLSKEGIYSKSQNRITHKLVTLRRPT